MTQDFKKLVFQLMTDHDSLVQIDILPVHTICFLSLTSYWEATCSKTNKKLFNISILTAGGIKMSYMRKLGAEKIFDDLN